MGAHLSTIQNTLKQQFQKQDVGQKGYLTVSELMAMQTQYGVSPCHLGVLYLIDRNRDGHFTLDELLEFAAFAYNYARVHRGQEAGFMIAGYASLRLWSALQDNQAQQFTDWAVKLFTEGYATAYLLSTKQPLVQQKALKAMHSLFDMERNHNVDYQTLRDMVHNAAEEEQLWNSDQKWPHREKWIPVRVLHVFVQALAEGMYSIMTSFTSDETELVEVLRRAEAAVAEQTRQRSRSSSGGGVLTPLNLKKQLYNIR